jgi:quercetin dioxygenase-like cupin family protein
MKPRIVRANEGSTKWAPADKFVGQVLMDQVFVPEDPSRLGVYRVTFTPGGRTNWQEILPGDTVIIPPNARHWHGAAPDQMMCHLALVESDGSDASTHWLEPVSDADYTAATA